MHVCVSRLVNWLGCTHPYTYMNPAQSNEIILALDQEELLLILSVTVIWASTLLWHDHMGYRERIPGLGKTDALFVHVSLLGTESSNNHHYGGILQRS